jgi:hypothetical protein
MSTQSQDDASQLVRQFLHNTPPHTQEIVNAIIAAVSSTKQNLDMAIKWGQLTFALEHDFHHWICAINITKTYVGINFHFGGLLEDPHHKFKAGTSRFLRKIEIRALSEVENDVIQNFIHQAVDKWSYFKANWKKIKDQTTA